MPVTTGGGSGGGLVATGGSEPPRPGGLVATGGDRGQPFVRMMAMIETMPASPDRAHMLERMRRLMLAHTLAERAGDSTREVDPRQVEWLEEIAAPGRNDAGVPAPLKVLAAQALEVINGQRRGNATSSSYTPPPPRTY